MTPSLVDRRARWAVSAVFFVLGAALGAWAPHIATVKFNLNLSSTVLGTALLAGTLGATSTMPMSSFLIHRFGSRTTVLLSGIALLVTMPLLVIAPTLPLFALALYAMGIFYGQFDVAMNTQSLLVQARYGRPVLSAIHGFYSIGGFAAGLGAALAAKVHALPVVHLIVNSVLMAVLLFASYTWMLPRSMDLFEEGERPKFVIPRGVLIPLGILTMFAFLSEGALWDWAAVYMRENLGSGAALGALGFGVFGLGMAIGRFLGDPFVHHFGGRAVLIASGLLATVGLLCSVSIPHPLVAMAGFMVAGLGLANMVPILFAASGRQPGFSPSYGLAAVTTCGYSGFLLGPPAIGWIADGVSLGVSFALVGILCFSVAVFGPRYVRQ